MPIIQLLIPSEMNLTPRREPESIDRQIINFERTQSLIVFG